MGYTPLPLDFCSFNYFFFIRTDVKTQESISRFLWKITMIFEISVQKYTKKFIFHRKIFPLKISPYSPSTFYFLRFNLYLPVRTIFMGNISRWKIYFFMYYSCNHRWDIDLDIIVGSRFVENNLSPKVLSFLLILKISTEWSREERGKGRYR